MRDITTPGISLRHIGIGLISIAIVGALAFYILFQARLLILGPQITLTEDPSGLQTEHVVQIGGRADNIVSLTLNGRPIFTDDGGAFFETLVLPEGYTIMALRAEDRYGREAVLTKHIVYQKNQSP